ncbi:MAG: LamG domain-containing protein, partial [Fibrobacter sp.]|nr:LamG domain-containing protein [Fibrobacter sp.]
STQYIILYWGNPDAETLLNDNAVFDTAAGFQGVWHLGDISGNGNIPDATVNKYNGVFPDTAEPQPSEGVIGNCRVFDGVDDFITMPNTSDSKLNFPEKGNYTVSAWVRLDTLDGEPHLIVAKGFSQYFLRFTYFPSDSPSWEFSEFSDTRLWQACTSSASSRQWTLVTGVREGNRQLLYCNGVLADSTPNSYPNDSFTRDMSNDLSVGKLLAAVEVHGVVNESHCFFKGSIDEIRIENRVRNSDWIKLCYMNQGPENMLVRFK